MTRDEAKAILAMPEDKAVPIILTLADRAEKYDQICEGVSPGTPSGMIPPYLKPAHRQRKKKPGRKKGHQGAARKRPDKVDAHKKHKLCFCPDCHSPVKKPKKT